MLIFKITNNTRSSLNVDISYGICKKWFSSFTRSFIIIGCLVSNHIRDDLFLLPVAVLMPGRVVQCRIASPRAACSLSG